MMRKRNEGMIKSFQNTIPNLPDKVKTKDFNLIENFDIDKWSSSVSGSSFILMTMQKKKKYIIWMVKQLRRQNIK